MNYYIQGNKEKAEEIKAAFETKGYKCEHNCDSMNFLYYTINNHVTTTGIQSHTRQLIMRLAELGDYSELELPVEFKDGDIIGFNDCTHNDGSYVDWVGIYRHQSNDFINHQHFFHCVATSKNTFRIGGSWRVFTAYPATKEQRDLLFKKMREAGYEWDANKKELRKIKPHYDIKNFKPFQKVLVRDDDNECWMPSLFGWFDSGLQDGKFVCGTSDWEQCIPFNDDTKHLLGTTDMCSEEYINW